MARISEYIKDIDITVHDKVLGSDVTGATRNYTFEDISKFFKTSNSAGVAGQANYTCSVGGGDSVSAGQCDLVTSGGTSLANVTEIKMNKFAQGDFSNSIENLLTIFNNKDVLIVQQDDQDNFGIYTAGTVQASDGEGGNVKKLALTHKSSNGNIADGKQYAVKFVPGDVDKNYTHNQSSASTTWTINHGLNKFPSVSIKFSSSDSVYTNVGAFAGVTYTDANNLTINLAAAESGYAYLN